LPAFPSLAALVIPAARTDGSSSKGSGTMTKTMRRLGTAAALALGTGAAGCAQLGGLENVLGGVMNPSGAGGNVAAAVLFVLEWCM
jgi:hypothetical protein